jgi:hypothetical protein
VGHARRRNRVRAVLHGHRAGARRHGRSHARATRSALCSGPAHGVYRKKAEHKSCG